LFLEKVAEEIDGRWSVIVGRWSLAVGRWPNETMVEKRLLKLQKLIYQIV
jgi:hypothetical protein